jgi:hypothetical protein
MSVHWFTPFALDPCKPDSSIMADPGGHVNDRILAYGI